MADIYSDLVDNIITDQSPSEIADNIQNILYSKIGEKIDGMEQEVAQSIFDDDVVEESADISEAPYTVTGPHAYDNVPKKVGRTYSDDQKKAARRYKDKKDSEYGAAAYRVNKID